VVPRGSTTDQSLHPGENRVWKGSPMDSDRFDALTQRLTSDLSRRRSLGLLATLALPGLIRPDTAEARKHKKKPCPPCKKRHKGTCKKKLPDGTACARGTCQGGACVPCISQDPALVCAGRCGITSDNCGRAVTCTCPVGQTCLANGGCARTCNPAVQDCPTSCRCSGARSAEGAIVCTPKSVATCDQVPQPCTTTIECPQGTICQSTSCGTGGALTNR